MHNTYSKCPFKSEHFEYEHHGRKHSVPWSTKFWARWNRNHGSFSVAMHLTLLIGCLCWFSCVCAGVCAGMPYHFSFVTVKGGFAPLLYIQNAQNERRIQTAPKPGPPPPPHALAHAYGTELNHPPIPISFVHHNDQCPLNGRGEWIYQQQCCFLLKTMMYDHFWPERHAPCVHLAAFLIQIFYLTALFCFVVAP